MTVIAIFHDLGLAFSDVMLSTDEPGGHISMPSTGHTQNLDVELPFSPTKLVRKFFRFSHNGKAGMFLVAGTVKHIKRLVVNIKQVKDNSHRLPSKYKNILSLKDVRSIIHVACLFTEEEGFHEFEILGVIDGHIFSRLFDNNRVLESAPYFGNTRIAGSGANDLHRWICERGYHFAKREFSHEPLDLKIARTINLIPSLLLEEDTRATFATINKGVGGYYESYFISEETIVPLDSVLTIFAAIKGKGNRSFLEIRRVLYHRYVSDWLLVVSLFNLPVEIYPGEEKAFFFKDFELFKIPPLLEDDKGTNWQLSRLAIEMNQAENFRLTLYREEEGEDKVSKRFAEGINGRRLMSIKVVNSSVVLSIQINNFHFFLEKFRSKNPENKAIPLLN